MTRPPAGHEPGVPASRPASAVMGTLRRDGGISDIAAAGPLDRAMAARTRPAERTMARGRNSRQGAAAPGQGSAPKARGLKKTRRPAGPTA